MSEPRIVIADDHPIVRAGVKNLLASKGYTLVEECEDGKQALDYCIANPVDLVLMDINMPVMDGYEATSELRKACPNVKVIALSMLNSDVSLIRMIRSGAKSYVLKESPAEELDAAIKAVLAHGYYYSEFVSSRLIESFGTKKSEDAHELVESLTEREISFLNYACTELTYREIADKMSVSHRSVDGYRDSLFTKLDLKSRVGLALFAIKYGLVQV